MTRHQAEELLTELKDIELSDGKMGFSSTEYESAQALIVPMKKDEHTLLSSLLLLPHGWNKVTYKTANSQLRQLKARLQSVLSQSTKSVDSKTPFVKLTFTFGGDNALQIGAQILAANE